MTIRKIYLDMDGVLADFDSGVRELCGIEPPPQDERWQPGEQSAKQGTELTFGEEKQSVRGFGCCFSELGAKALDYYERTYGYRPGYADTDDNGDGTYTIHLYDITNGHTATSAWYNVDAWGYGTDAIFGETVDLNS